MRVADLPAGAGVQWVRNAWQQWLGQPGAWISLLACWTILSALVFLAIPLLGQFIAVMLQPALFAGFVIAARDQEAGKRVVLSHLFAGFHANGRALLSLGALVLVARALLRIVASQFDMPAAIPFDTNGMPNPQAYFAQFDGLLWIVFFGTMAVSLLIDGVLWFAVPLLALNPMRTSHAIRWSFYAFAGNFLPMLGFAIIMTMVFFFGMLPLFLGMLVAMPIYALTHYTSYRQVFQPD